MAITRAQQVRQMLKEGSMKPVEQAGVMNYMPSEMVTVPKIAKSSPDTPTAKLAYITPEEQNILVDLNLYGSLDGKPNRGPGGIPSLEGDFESYTRGLDKAIGRSSPPPGSPDYNRTATFDDSPPMRTRIQNEQQEEFRRKQIKDLVDKQQEEKAFEPFETLIVKPSNLPGPAGTVINATIPFRQKTLDRNLDFYRFDPRTRKAREKYGLTAQGYKDYMTARLAGEIDAAGNIIYSQDDDDPIIFPQDMEDNTGGGGGGDDADDEDDTNTGGLALRFRKDGGSINAMDGGMMSPVGGIMDLESGRQMYFLGKLVKKATRAVKKIAKSPIGKAALAFGAFKFGPQLLTGEGLGLGKTKAFKDLIFFGKDANVNPMRLAGLASIAPLLFGTGEEEEEDQTIDRGPGLDVAGIRNNPYDFLGTRFAADGGIMRTGYQQGSKEPVAKKTMPLLDMGGKEMDLREDGGFVPIGRMEKADDVPARLSKNEFVFTADAVRNAGEGDVDKGAEVMYNMMKNLESGGEVSEESQGLSGAREMFQTSKRLEEVL